MLRPYYIDRYTCGVFPTTIKYVPVHDVWRPCAQSKTDKPWYEGLVSPVLMQAFIMTFLAEWGDRSQIATIAMGADYNPWGIIVGASLGWGRRRAPLTSHR